MPKHPFEDIRDGKTGGRSLLWRAFEAFRLAVPVSTIRDRGLAGIAEWPAWQILREGAGRKIGGLAAVFTDPAGPLHFVTRRGAERGAALAPLRDPDAFDLVPGRERAARWAAFHGGDQLLSETAKTRRAVAETISRAIREGPARQAARDIVAVQGFGLNPRLEAQLRRDIQAHRERWQRDGVAPKAIQRRAQRRARKLHKRLLLRRASGIWTYQKRTAMYEGLRQMAEEALAVGQLTSENVLIWDHAGSGPGHPCARCESLIGTEAGILSPFSGKPVEGGGSRYNGRTLVRRRPPDHLL